MKCVIPGLNIKVFARAVHSLSKVGDELYVEPNTNGVAFRSVNSSRSAFASFCFSSNFFSVFDFKIPEDEQENFKCKIVMKAFVNVFKSVNNVEKSVEKCRIVIDSEEDRLVVHLTCKHNINKTYNLPFIECQTLQAVFDKESCPFSIQSQSRVLCDALFNFQAGQEEVTLSVSKQRALLKNYVDDDPDPLKVIHTELHIEADEFDEYNVGSQDLDTEVTFCLKELRSLLSFSEPGNLPVCFRFSTSGNPIIFSVESSSMFEADFVLATLASTALSQTQSCGQTVEQRSQIKSIRKNETKVPQSVSNTNGQHICNGSRDVAATKLSYLNGNSPQVKLPVQTNLTLSTEDHVENSDKDDEEVVAGTPPAKKRKFFFQRCFQSTFNAMDLTPFQRVLAEDSDEDS